MKKMKMAILCFMISTAFFSMNAQAATEDICAKLPGFWVGETHLKNPTDCNLYNGCSHLVMISAESIQDTKYRLKVHLTDGVNVKQQTADIYCENGNINIPDQGKYTISTSCDGMNHCFLVYDSARFSAELIKK